MVDLKYLVMYNLYIKITKCKYLVLCGLYAFDIRCVFMKFYLLKMKVFGVKNIDKEIVLNFYKQTLSKTIDYENYNVKAIYGTNGAGKTALISAVDLYKKYCTDPSFLVIGNSNGSLQYIINQKTKTMRISMTFVIINDKDEIRKAFEHVVEIGFINGRYCVKEEILNEIKGARVNTGRIENIFHIKNGALENYSGTEKNKELLVELTKNLLFDKSFENVLVENIDKIDNVIDDYHWLFIANLFAKSLTVVLNSEDHNYIDYFDTMKQVKVIKKQKDLFNNKDEFINILSRESFLKDDSVFVGKDDFDSYKSQIDGMFRFLKVFKNDLLKIRIDKDETGSGYACKLVLEYEDGRNISRIYESAGIKKLMSIYYALCNVENGGIVFIDEFDANIHDVILTKLIEYIKKYTQGQFVFTTHNLGPMDVLQHYKNSIDFISDDSEIISWAKVGNSPAAKVYRRGLIKHSPFNIEPFSFMGVFIGDDANE